MNHYNVLSDVRLTNLFCYLTLDCAMPSRRSVLLRLVKAYVSVNRSYELRTPKTKTPSITMGFRVLGGRISCFAVQLQRAVMPCD